MFEQDANDADRRDISCRFEPNERKRNMLHEIPDHLCLDPGDRSGAKSWGPIGLTSTTVQRAGHRKRFPLCRKSNPSRFSSLQREPILLSLLRRQQILQRNHDLAQHGVLEEINVVDDLNGNDAGVLVCHEEFVRGFPGGCVIRFEDASLVNGFATGAKEELGVGIHNSAAVAAEEMRSFEVLQKIVGAEEHRGV